MGVFLDLIFQQGVPNPLVVADQGDPQVRDIGRGFLDKKVSQEQGAKHLKGSDALLGAALIKGPWVHMFLDLVVEPEDILSRRGLQVGEPSADIRQAMIRGTGVTSPRPNGRSLSKPLLGKGKKQGGQGPKPGARGRWTSP